MNLAHFSQDMPSSPPCRLCAELTLSPEKDDVLPGEEALHEHLQRQLIATLIQSHRSWGLVVQVKAKLKESGSWGLFRSIQAAPGRYSCELVEISPTDGSFLDSRFFTLVPPEEERSRASIIVLAKAAALIDSPNVHPLRDGQFDEVARLRDAAAR